MKTNIFSSITATAQGWANRENCSVCTCRISSLTPAAIRRTANDDCSRGSSSNCSSCWGSSSSSSGSNGSCFPCGFLASAPGWCHCCSRCCCCRRRRLCLCSRCYCKLSVCCRDNGRRLFNKICSTDDGPLVRFVRRWSVIRCWLRLRRSSSKAAQAFRWHLARFSRADSRRRPPEQASLPHVHVGADVNNTTDRGAHRLQSRVDVYSPTAVRRRAISRRNPTLVRFVDIRKRLRRRLFHRSKEKRSDRIRRMLPLANSRKDVLPQRDKICFSYYRSAW